MYIYLALYVHDVIIDVATCMSMYMSPRTRSVVGSNPTQGIFFFEKRESCPGCIVYLLVMYIEQYEREASTVTAGKPFAVGVIDYAGILISIDLLSTVFLNIVRRSQDDPSAAANSLSVCPAWIPCQCTVTRSNDS